MDRLVLRAFLETSSKSGPGAGRVTYTGGYVLPGTTPGAGQAALPLDLEQAVVDTLKSRVLAI